ISDGTLAGTHMIAETIPGPGSSGTTPSNFTAAGGLVFFRAGTSATGDELWATDGTADGTGLVRDIYPGSNSSLPSFLTEHNGALYLRGFNSSGNYIWTSDGTTAGTIQLPLPTSGYTLAENLCSHDGWLYFSGSNGTSRQLWRTNGTAEGTQELLLPGSDTPQPLDVSGPMRSCDGQLFFRANYATGIGQELYTLSPSTAMDNEQRKGLLLHPNPAADILWFDGYANNSTFAFHGADGRLVMTIPAAGQVDISNLEPGIYIARVLDGTSTVILQQKVVVDR
ncbi:MAG: T9SS type A sorting domain-containing protein, partial [Flavobacteriales bacterium]